MQKRGEVTSNDLTLRCYKFGLNILRLADTLPSKRSSWVIADQLIRSATSVGANVVEAKAASSRLEFKRYHEIALKSANETKYWLCLLRDHGLLDKDVAEPPLQEIGEIANMLAAGILKLKGKRE